MVSALLAGRGGHGRWTPMLVRADVATMSLGSTYLVTIVVKRHPRSNHQHQWYPGNMRPPLREQWSEKSPYQVSNFWVKCSIAAIGGCLLWTMVKNTDLSSVCVSLILALTTIGFVTNWFDSLTSSTILLGKTSSRHERDIFRYYCLIFP